MKLLLGIDDAGRGPVIGPMILAGCMIDEATEKEFRSLGVRDSKQITPLRREFLAKEEELKMAKELIKHIQNMGGVDESLKKKNKPEVDKFMKYLRLKYPNADWPKSKKK